MGQSGEQAHALSRRFNDTPARDGPLVADFPSHRSPGFSYFLGDSCSGNAFPPLTVGARLYNTSPSLWI